MKTENLTWEEAIKAYVNGATIEDSNCTLWKIEEGNPFNKYKRDPVYTLGAIFYPAQGPFRIVQKTWTAEEVLRIGQEVKIELPFQEDPICFNKATNWLGGEIALVYFAFQQGWKVEVSQ